MNPKILIAIGDLLGCGYYRCLMPYQALVNQGFDVTITNVLNEQLVKQYDVLLLQRQHSEGVLNMVKWYKEHVPNGKIVFEFDDNLHALPPGNPNRKVYTNGSPATKNMEAMLRLSDMLTVSTTNLGNAYSKFCSNVKVCHNSFDPAVLAELDAYNPEKESKGSEFRLGWAGSGTHHDDFVTIIKPLTEVLRERPNVKFVTMGVDMRYLFEHSTRKQMEYFGDTFPRNSTGGASNYDQSGLNPTVEYYKLLKRAHLDAAIAPLQNYTFNACKSYIKLMEYGAAKIPFVATRFGPYMDYVGPYSFDKRFEAVGLNPSEPKLWKKALLEIIDNAELRKQLVENNYKNLVAKHTMDSNINEWVAAYASIGLLPGPNPGVYKEMIDKQQQVA